jgi:site-specific DNA-adenine methylase
MEELTKANYIGNKRRFADYIVGKFPEGGKSAFDPTCGCSSVLIEAAKNGYKVQGNDLSIVPYWYSKGVFEGAAFSEADIEKFVNTAPRDGWLTTEWKGTYPRKPEIRRYIDGLVIATKNFPGDKLHTARAIVSRLLQTMYSDSGSGYSTRNWETIPDVKRILASAIKEVNGLIGEVGGKGTVTNLDARKMSFPSSDVVYYDPPFFRKDKGHVLYFNSYKVSNSVLLQKEWKEENLKKEEAVDILHRLCKSTGHIFISSARNCQVPWAAEVAKFKKMVKKFKITYRQTSGFPSGRDEEQRENLVFGKAKEGVNAAG